MVPEPSLKSVNWVPGMLLTPEHFLEQERFTDDLVGWVLRYASSVTGLVGAGARRVVPPEKRHTHDPDVDLVGFEVFVRSVRGITPSGRIVEVAEPLRGIVPAGEIPRDGYYLTVVHPGSRAESRCGAEDAPARYRHVPYRLELATEPDRYPDALVVARLVDRSDGDGLRVDPDYLPPCASVLAHSRLYANWTQLQAELAELARRVTENHPLVADYIRFVERHHESPTFDRQLLTLVERVAAAVDDCISTTSDPGQSPRTIFGAVELLGARVGLALGLVARDDRFHPLAPDMDDLRKSFRTLPETARDAGFREDHGRAAAQALAVVERIAQVLDAVRHGTKAITSTGI